MLLNLLRSYISHLTEGRQWLCFSLILKTKWLWCTKNKLWLKLSLFLCLRGRDEQINSCQVRPAQTSWSLLCVAKSQAGHRLFPPGRARRPTQTLMAFTSQTVNPTEESGVTFQAMWGQIREACGWNVHVALKSNTRVWAFVKKKLTWMETKAASNLSVNCKY